MAKKADSKDEKEVVEIAATVSKIEQYIDKNQKKLTYSVAAILLIIIGVMLYKNYVVAPREAEAQNVIWHAQNAFANNLFEVALNGDETVTGFAEIVDSYGSTSVGNLARAYAGFCCVKLDLYNEAVSYLSAAKIDDPILTPLILSALGDSYVELEQYEKAASYFLDAAKVADHAMLSPKFLMKAGLVYEKLDQKQKAKEVYSTIKDKYESSSEGAIIDKYLIRVNL